MTGKESKSKEPELTRAQTILKGLGMFVSATVGGVLVLALIGLIPGHQDSPLLGKVIAVISLAMYGSAGMGAWLVLKECLDWLWEGVGGGLRRLRGAASKAG